jgi:D-alanyl-D-alanine carboxypeptidase (penicillin-binding protein 5/6)
MTIRKTIAVVVMLGALTAALAAAPAMAAQIETLAKQAYMIDAQTGTVLLDKNGEQPMPPSSMAKMMTIHIVFDRLKQGRLSLKDEFLVSEKAWRMQGSKMFVELGKKISVENLLRGVIVQSGNDATVVLAEGISGDEGAFADLMNSEARKMGLTDSHFMNASGWPADGQVVSARDLAKLALSTIRDYPELYKIYAEVNFTWHGIKQGNRNPLLYMNIGADGLKTGHTEAAGYGLTASAVRSGRRLILVLNGMSSMRERSQESAKLMEWGFREFNNYALFKKGDTVDSAAVWLGTESSVPLIIDRDLTVTLPRAASRAAKVTAMFNAPVAAPITAGRELGKVRITMPDVAPIEVPLKAGKSVDRLGFMGRLNAAISYLLWGSQKSSAR